MSEFLFNIIANDHSKSMGCTGAVRLVNGSAFVSSAISTLTRCIRRIPALNKGAKKSLRKVKVRLLQQQTLAHRTRSRNLGQILEGLRMGMKRMVDRLGD
jgi:hypothetical protein